MTNMRREDAKWQLTYDSPHKKFARKELSSSSHTQLAHLAHGIGEPSSDLVNNYRVWFGVEKPEA